ncbi:type VI secretion system tip protein TssI/VgrG [Vibrio rumoiensis]|uniref:type VI secretion system tip protein TssI/VgrG n=1 Tax=Vibrio rumoiensis TaxID=76258 RepID=UPI003749D3EC
MAALQFSIHVDGVSDESLVVISYQGKDNFSSVQQADGSWCHGFRYQIELASRRPDITALDVVDKNAELVMHRDGEVVQRINGIVRAFSVGETGHHHTFYSLTLVPEIERLSLRHNSRIFQSISTPDIIATLFKEMDIQNFAFALTRTPKLREFCMQYRETDLAFINRLAAEEGMVYHIEQSKAKHTVLFTDDSQLISSLDAPIPYNAMASGISSTPYINTFTKTTQFEVSEAHSGDSSFKKPQYTFAQQAVGSDMDYQRDTYQHFDFPGRFKDDATGKAFNQLRLDSLRRNAHTAKGTSNEPQLQTGAKFDMQDHSDDSFNQSWLIIASHHQGDQPQALEESAGGKPTTYANQFEAIPADKTWRLPQMTKPQVDGPMTAYVVGPEGEEIFCDEYGRVRLHFPWDRYSNGDEHSSCWVQVSQGWAGSQYGMIAIPRIGHEVIVSFLNGDPDQPIVTGRAFNAQNIPPYTLPDNKTKTVWRSETHQGEGFNEISFEDQADREQVYLHAQKDFKAEVQNDAITDINHDQHLTVENDQFTQIKNNHNLTVEGESAIQVKGNSSQEVSGSIQQKIGSTHVMEAGKEISLISGGKLVVEAGSEVTLKVGGSFVKVDAAGVHLVGPGVNLNSGGSAGSASTYSASAPMLPKGVEPVAPPQAPPPVSLQSLKTAELANVTAVKPCPLAATSTAAGISSSSITSAEEREQSSIILKSGLLKASGTLNQLASGSASAYRKGSKGDEVAMIQQALIKVGFDLGASGADGDFGSTTERQVKAFQQNYKPSHQTHSEYQVGSVDGIVGKGTILGLDEAVVGGWRISNKESYNWADSDFGLLLGSVESKNDYSAYNRTKGGLRSFFNTNITDLTIKDVQYKQSTREMFAVGRFQLIPSTLKEAVNNLQISTDVLFKKEIQDDIFNRYLIRIKSKCSPNPIDIKTVTSST